ncbi:MAG: ubiquitin-like domain-containing protein [Chloroflexota bacterium]|nr:ubiquitin-like domain-containing protein [Dehalococcoidia bacterium]MDW8253417.1 ubiquitin-like domain-containing protein [Chloroflexota bacterium]
MPPAAAVGVGVLGALAVIAGALLHQTVTLEADGQTRRITTLHRHPVALLRDAGVALRPGDRLEEGPVLLVRRGQPIIVDGDGRRVALWAAVDDPLEAARAAGFHLDPHDRVVRVAPRPTPTSAPGHADDEAPLRATPLGGAPLDSVLAAGERFQVQRAVPITVHDGGMTQVVWTTSATVGEAVVQGGIELWAGDLLRPAAATPVQAGLHVWVLRALPVRLEVDGRLLQTRSRAATVGELLRQEGIALEPSDRVEPALDSPLPAGPIRVIRVRSETLTFQEPIAFGVVYRDDPDLPLGQSRVIEEGAPGIRRWTSRIVYENGREVAREVIRSWIETPPQPRVVARGTKLVFAEITTDSGEVATAWAKIRVYVTAYNATSAGKPKGSPGFGITSTGKRAGRGIIAVDPAYIPYGTRIYVPGYGIGVADDTGGGLRGPHIDLCFDDDEPITWRSRFVEVYLLTPAPPLERVRHLLAQ